MKTAPHYSSATLKQRLSEFLHLRTESRSTPTKFTYILILLTILSFLYLTFSSTGRYAVFAGYSSDGKVAPYTIDYLKGLREVTDGIVYITDSPLLPEEQKKIAPYVLYSAHAHHGEYDWGSYKRGYNWLKNNGFLKKAKELIFANDSAYAPIKSFKPMFKSMSLRQELDFWGNTQNSKFNPHLQSYFLVFRRPVLRSRQFSTFINSVKPQPHHSLYITEYEVKLTPYLKNLGYKWDSYIPNFSKNRISTDPNSYPLTELKKYESQFLKRRTFTEKLPIEEDKAQLMQWLQKKAPKVHNHVITDFPVQTSDN